MKETEITAFISLPNFFTLANATLGLFAIYFILIGDLILSSRFILMAIFFDSFDGFLARKKNSIADFGRSLDSLSDIISFGIAPAFIFISSSNSNIFSIFLGFIYVLCGLLRLSRFNALDREGYIGLPITIGAIFIVLIFLANIPYFLNAVMLIITSILFISTLKLKRPTKKGNTLVISSTLFILVSLIPYPHIEIVSRILLVILPLIFLFYLIRCPQS